VFKVLLDANDGIAIFMLHRLSVAVLGCPSLRSKLYFRPWGMTVASLPAAKWRGSTDWSLSLQVALSQAVHAALAREEATSGITPRKSLP
jgi:hypothetical protein